MMVDNMITYDYILKPILNCVFLLIIVTVSLLPGMLAHSPFLIDGREGGAVQFGPVGEKVTAFESMMCTEGAWVLQLWPFTSYKYKQNPIYRCIIP